MTSAVFRPATLPKHRGDSLVNNLCSVFNLVYIRTSIRNNGDMGNPNKL